MKVKDLVPGNTYYYNMGRLGIQEIIFVEIGDDKMPVFLSSMGECQTISVSNSNMNMMFDSKKMAHLKSLKEEQKKLTGDILKTKEKINTLVDQLDEVEKALSPLKEEFPEEFL